MAYELWSIAPPNLPARSRLYSLLPMGIGSALVESLTSYMMRLAEAHAVSPGTLVRQEVFPNLAVSPKRLSHASLHSLNGLSPCFARWVRILEELTGARRSPRPDVAPLARHSCLRWGFAPASSLVPPLLRGTPYSWACYLRLPAVDSRIGYCLPTAWGCPERMLSSLREALIAAFSPKPGRIL